jgi:hypothetical protein
MNPYMLPKLRSDQIMASAAGQECTLRIASFLPGHRCSGNNTTIGAHLPVFGKGMSTKVTDMAVVYCCANCHAILDGVDYKAAEYIRENYAAAAAMRMLNALVETHALLIEQGILIVKDGRLV